MNAARFKVKTQRGCLCISEGNQLSSELYHWHFDFILPIMLDKTAFMSADRAAFVYRCSVRDFRALSTIHLIKFGTSESRAQIIWFSSGLQSAERKSFGSVRDFRAQSANHLIQFGTSERKSFGSDRDFRAQSANHLVQFGTSEHRAHVCMYIYIVYEISKGSNMFTKTCFKIYLDKYIFCQYIL